MDLIDALTRNQSLLALSKYMRHAQRLYQWLIQPIVAELKPLSSMIKFLSNMLILLSLLKSKNILYILLNQVLMFFSTQKT